MPSPPDNTSEENGAEEREANPAREKEKGRLNLKSGSVIKINFYV